MKKGLSILLVAAAIFGFYGSAVNVNDILACKDYWEEAGEKSTADMNKLEDGLNQLKDNEQAYLDGLDQVAEGEEALADGEAQYAQGLADYAAAPGKLADARKQIAAGEAALSKGKDDLDSLNTLIDGIQAVLENYPTFKNGYTQLKEARVNTLSEKSMAATQELLPKVLLLVGGAGSEAGQKLMSAAGTMTQQSGSVGFKNSDYDDFNDALLNMKEGLEAAKTNLDSTEEGLATALAAYTTEVSVKVSEELTVKMSPLKAIDVVKAGPGDEYLIAAGILAGDGGENPGFIASFKPQLGTLGQAVAALDGDELSDYQSAAAAFDISNLDNIKSVYDILSNTDDSAQSYQELLNGKITDAATWTGGYSLLNQKRTDTKAGLPYLSGGVAQIIGGVLGSGNAELISGMNKAAKAYGINPKDFTPVEKSQLTKDLGSSQWMEDFLADGNKIESVFKAVLPSLKAKAKSGANQLKAGKKQLADGKAQYAQGLKDYAAAPGKLADAEQQLADGRAQLAAGKDQLAQYEDGEQQVRDGLATLVGTEADLDLESILDRLNGDSDFDNGDNHLELDEGLAAVEVGRGYQAEDGELITKEIMTRAIATGGLLAAGVLAVLAAILSFTKKNKGAGVFAILSAVAGAFGAYEATQAGSYFSSIAGSTVGQSGMIAAGILGCVALVHAIVHFTAKKEA